MKKFYTLLVVCFVFVLSLQSQHFLFSPTDNYEGYQSVDEYKDHVVYQDNLTGGELTLSWENLSYDISQEWFVTMCDFGGCYTGIPAGGTMLPIGDTLQGFLKITVNPNGFAGTGTAVFRVWDYKHPEQMDTVYFTIHAGVFTGIDDKISVNQLHAYPNPATDWITIENLENQSSVKLISQLGQIVLEQENNISEQWRVNVSEFPPGIYFLISEDYSGNFEKQKLIIK
ncbi:MAG: T9SS type A sorting domain-containing protein [Bacteroidales bacterium]